MTGQPDTASVLLNGLSRYLTTEQLERLGSVRVGIAGAGGLGSNCALMLARSGFRQFIVADHDTVDTSNLNRQMFTAAQIGKPKVQALADNIHALDAEISVVTHEVEVTADNVFTLFSGCDVIIEAVDTVEAKRMLVERFMGADAFYVTASGMAGWGGPPMQVRQIRDSVVMVGDFTTDISQKPPMAPRVIMAAAMQADAVLCHVLGTEG